MRYGNGVIRQLLRRLKRPAELESLPLGKALRHALGAPSAFEAARIAIDNAFAACGPAGERYRKIIWSYDVERTITREEAAEELAVSPRHFFRLRAEAVQALSDYVARLLGGPAALRDPINDAAQAMLEFDPAAASQLMDLAHDADLGDKIDALSRMATQMNDLETIDLRAFAGLHRVRALLILSYVADLRGDHEQAERIRIEARADKTSALSTSDPLVEYEIATIEFTAARYSGTAQHLLARAEAVERLGKILGGEHAIAPLLLVAEAAILAGRPARAREVIDLAFYAARENRHYRVLGYALLRSAQLEMLEGKFENALRLARASAIALRTFPDGRLSADETIGRISTLLGLPWSAEAAQEGSLWLKLASAGMRLRNALATGSLSHADVATEAHANAEQAEATAYLGLAAFSYATAASAALALRRSDANALALHAWQLLVRSGNHLLAVDLFAFPGRIERDLGPLTFDDATARAISATLAGIPGMGSFGNASAIEPLALVWPTVLAVSGGSVATTVPAEYAQSVARGLVAGGVTASTFERISNGALRELVTWTSAMPMPDDRQAFERRLTRTLRTFQYQVERAVAQERYRMASHLSAC